MKEFNNVQSIEHAHNIISQNIQITEEQLTLFLKLIPDSQALYKQNSYTKDTTPQVFEYFLKAAEKELMQCIKYLIAAHEEEKEYK